MSGYVMSTGAHHTTSQFTNDHDQGSFVATHSTTPHDNYLETPSSTTAELVFNPWLLDFTSADPLARTSSFGGSEYIPAPASYMGLAPMYPMVDPSIPHHSDYIVRDAAYVDGQEMMWQPQFSGVATSQPPLAQGPLPAWNVSSYADLSIPPVEYYTQSFVNHSASSFPSALAEAPTMPYSTTGFEPCETENGAPTSDSDDEDSNPEDSSSRANNHNGSRLFSGSNQSGPPTNSMLVLGRWGAEKDPLTCPSPRHYFCEHVDRSGPTERRCEQGFQRPEHLRRHVKTVHGKERNFHCKVPQCQRAFSRGDNLREHYWSHLHRGGRAGKNDKMSLAELKAILGSKEKKLLRRLKQRLIERQVKQQSKS